MRERIVSLDDPLNRYGSRASDLRRGSAGGNLAGRRKRTVQSRQRTVRRGTALCRRSLSHNMPADHKPDRMRNARRRSMARAQAAAAEVLPHKCTLTGQWWLGVPDTQSGILRRRPALRMSAPASHNPARMREVVRNTWNQASHKPGSHFGSQHERWQTQYRRRPAPRRQIAESRLRKLAVTRERQAQEQKRRISW
jgi:hypothetical protein